MRHDDRQDKRPAQSKLWHGNHLRGWPVSRILSPGLPRMDDHSSGAPVARRPLAANPDRSGSSIPAVDIPCRINTARGPYLALLPVGLAVPVRLPVPRWALTPPFHLFPRIEGSLFSVALSLGLPPPGVTRHRALWSPDFPRTHDRPAAIQPSAQTRS